MKNLFIITLIFSFVILSSNSLFSKNEIKNFSNEPLYQTAEINLGQVDQPSVNPPAGQVAPALREPAPLPPQNQTPPSPKNQVPPPAGQTPPQPQTIGQTLPPPPPPAPAPFLGPTLNFIIMLLILAGIIYLIFLISKKTNKPEQKEESELKEILKRLEKMEEEIKKIKKE